MVLAKSVAKIGRVDEERIRKVAADNPDLLHARLAVRFGISVTRLRKIIGARGGELLLPEEMVGRPGAYAYTRSAFRHWRRKCEHTGCPANAVYGFKTCRDHRGEDSP